MIDQHFGKLHRVSLGSSLELKRSLEIWCINEASRANLIIRPINWVIRTSEVFRDKSRLEFIGTGLYFLP